MKAMDDVSGLWIKRCNSGEFGVDLVVRCSVYSRNQRDKIVTVSGDEWLDTMCFKLVKA